MMSLERLTINTKSFIESLGFNLVSLPLLAALVVATMATVSGYLAAHEETAIFLLIVAFILPAVVIIRYPFIGVVLLVAMVPLEELITVGGTGGTVIRIYGIPIACVWLISVIIERRRLYIPPGSALLVMILLWDGLSLSWANSPAVAGERLVTEVQLVALYFMCTDLVRSKKETRVFVGVFTGMAFLAALVGVRNLLDPDVIRVALTDLRGGGAVQFGHLMALGAITSIVGVFSTRGRFRCISLVFSLVFILALVSTVSRSNLVGFVVAVILLVLFTYIRRYSEGISLQLLLLTGVLLIISGLAITNLELLPSETLDRFSPDIIIASEGAGRGDFWRVGLQMVLDKPFTGVGLDNFPDVYYGYAINTPDLLRAVTAGRDAHSDYLRRITETGIIGFIMFVGFLAIIFRKAIQARLMPVDRFLWTSSFGMLLVTLVSSFGNTYQWRKRYWIVLALVMIVYRLAAKSSFLQVDENPNQSIPNVRFRESV